MAGVAATNISCSNNKEALTFGLITDLHYADINRKPNKTRYYRHSLDKLKVAIDEFNKQKVDFLIELGDLKDQPKDSNKKVTISYLRKTEKELQKFNGPVYHVIGNHDVDCISKSDFLSNIKNGEDDIAKNYYSFIKKGIKFIVLDANYTKDGTDYDSGNFMWDDTYIPKEQMDWLKQELSDPKQTSVIFVHQQLDSFHRENDPHCIRNAKEVRNILELNNNVMAVFQGHNHAGGYQCHKGIHYYTLKAMVEGPSPENSFSIAKIDNDNNLTVTNIYK
ncbi:hypothetical protein E9993_15260 [Labilibacter sediminis]|nr:hypothetical protein E9993_15260 [Labilibacter sediminis]